MRCVLLRILDALQVPEVLCSVLLFLLKVLEVPEVMHCVLLYMLEALQVLQVLEMMCCVLLCLLEVPEVMRRVLLLYILPGEMAAKLGWFLPQFVVNSFFTSIRSLSIRCFNGSPGTEYRMIG
jgi:hypothetical protein